MTFEQEGTHLTTEQIFINQMREEIAALKAAQAVLVSALKTCERYLKGHDLAHAWINAPQMPEITLIQLVREALMEAENVKT